MLCRAFQKLLAGMEKQQQGSTNEVETQTSTTIPQSAPVIAA
jgi:hypothetical protein